MDIQKIDGIIDSCIKHIEAKEFKSYDLFDALTNPLINNLTFHFNILRRIANQINSRSPFDIHWSGMKKMVHTKLISDLVWLFSLKGSVYKANQLFNCLLDLRTKNYQDVWGLNFPYTSRFVNAGVDTPNLYNTSTSGLAICELCMLDKENEIIYHQHIEKIIDSMFKVFEFHDEKSKGWFLYYPSQNSPTYNVNALAAYFLCKAGNSFNSQVFPDIIEKIISLLIEEQNADGSWHYSRSEKGKWVDGFHTGFIIESLLYIYSHGFASANLLNALKKAWEYYIKNLFTPEGFPKYLSNSSRFPIEAQNCAQAIQTLSLAGIWMRWDQKELLEKVITNTVSNLYDSSGYFYHKRTRHYTYKNSYLRWSTSPMLVALTYAESYSENVKVK